MEPKKSVKADLEWRKPVFFEIGLCVALALTLMAFEFIGPREKAGEVFQTQAVIVDDEMVIQTKREEVTPPPPPAAPMTSTVIEIVENNIDIDNDADFDSEFDENEATDTYEVDEVGGEEVVEEEIYVVVEEEASFPGGEEALYDFLGKNMVYPSQARAAGIEGVVLVEFVVEPSGKVTNVRAKRKVSPLLDEEAVRVVKMLPPFSPGKQRGKAVRSYFHLPVSFSLYD
ncbi:MAG: energy transducer TonB [Bacteroidales bacterium]|nr:energy transducer TonB [Bacteroidales bacterium]